jgi:hypothetical protein
LKNSDTITEDELQNKEFSFFFNSKLCISSLENDEKLLDSDKKSQESSYEQKKN